MDKELLNIVVTGGPCGGKTTALDELTKLLRSYGYNVVIVPETATEMMNNGMLPYGDNGLEGKDFQELLLDLQLAKEKVARESTKRNRAKKTAIIYDRGVLDNRAYLDDETFQSFLKDRGISESEILSSYDLVIHLVTAAIGKEEFYTKANNAVRMENVEEARLADKKTMETWKNHPNLRVVANDTLFNEKIEKVKNYIREYIGEEKVVKKERYLLNISDIDFNTFFKNYEVVKEDLESFVIYNQDGYNEMYSKSTIYNSSYYTCTTNILDMNGISKSICRPITKEEYELGEIKNKSLKLNKIRYNFIDNNERFRLDLYNIDGNYYAILERDVAIITKTELPKFISNYIDITNNSDYDDDSICTDYNIDNIFKRRGK